MDLTKRPEFGAARQSRRRSRTCGARPGHHRPGRLDAAARTRSARPGHADGRGTPVHRPGAIASARRGCACFPIGSCPARPREVTIARVGANLAELGWFARGSGVGVLVESHGEFTDSASLEALMKAAGDAPGVGLVWDTHHTVSAGKEKPADTWARLGRWVHHTHIKDSTPGEKEVTYVLTGQGTIGVRDVVLALAGGRLQGVLRLRVGEAVAPGHRRAGGRLSAVRGGHDQLVVGGRSGGPLGRRHGQPRAAHGGPPRTDSAAPIPVKAPSMRAYMKSAMPYLGVQTPGLREACRLAFAAHPLDIVRRLARHGAGALAAGAVPRRALCRAAADRRAALSRLPDARRAAAVRGVDRHRRVVGLRGPDRQHAHRRAAAGGTRPGCAGRCGRGAARRTCGNGARRSCVSCRSRPIRTSRCSTTASSPISADREFFIRKAIGWALRQHAWTDAAEVTRYVNENRAPPEPAERARGAEERRGVSAASGKSGPALC